MDRPSLPRVLITPGEPAGVGPDVAIHIAQQAWPVEIIAIADPGLLLGRAAAIGLPLRILPFNEQEMPRAHQPGTLRALPVPLNAPVKVGKLDPANAGYVLHALETAATMCLEKTAAAIVTGPVHKATINEGGFAFTGHTEFFADLAHASHTVMLFVVEKLKVALASTHVPLARVATTITRESLRATIDVLLKGLAQYFGLSAPHILVCGLNPHAGENGHLGREEIDIIAPVINELRQHCPGLKGPLSADTVFLPKNLQHVDAVLAMYHDQALPLVKYIGFGHAVNVTLGLPFVRTSVDHGTAIDIAGKGLVDAQSMAAALQLAIELVTASSRPCRN